MIRVLVVDDHPVVRHGLMAILRWEKDIELVGDAADGLEAVRLILEQHPDVVLLDLRLPHLSGIEVMKQVRSQGLPDTLPRADHVRYRRVYRPGVGGRRARVSAQGRGA